ncbi:MAG: alpha-ribazole phosphatase [Pseudomonadota bacterium]
MGLIIVRHTRPLIAEGICYGRTDLNVADTFPDEAENVTASLPVFERIVSSPLTRCRKLADILAEQTGLSVTEDARVTEMDFGAWEGRPWSDIPRAELDAWAADFLHARPHGGESVAMLRRRVNDALSDWQSQTRSTLIVAHSGVIRAARATGDTADAFSTHVGFGEFVTIPSFGGEKR